MGVVFMSLRGFFRWLFYTTLASLILASAAVFGDKWIEAIKNYSRSDSLSNLLRPESSSLEACESVTLRLLKSPATYNRVDAVQVLKDSVIISFDSQNGYGALIRSQAICVFDKNRIVYGIQLNGESMLVDASGNVTKAHK
jgi:hypothetical protein